MIYEVEYFDGVTAGNKKALLYLNEMGVSLQDNIIWKEDAPVLFFPYNSCSIRILNNQKQLLLDHSATRYLLIPTDAAYLPVLQQHIEKSGRNSYDAVFGLNLLSLLLISVVLLLGLYLGFTRLVPYMGQRVISPDTEIELGEKMYKEVVKGEIIDHPKTVILQSFAKELHLSKIYPVKTTVVDSKEVNAFAMPGGNIVVYSGILKAMKSSDELAALLGHEVSHINGRHSLKTILQSVAMGMAVSIVLNDVSGIVAVLVQNAEMLRSMSYSRSIEQSADNEGMKLLVLNGIHPLAMKRLMQRLKANTPTMPDEIGFLSSHPSTEDRMRLADQFAVPYKNSSFVAKPVLDSLWAKLNH